MSDMDGKSIKTTDFDKNLTSAVLTLRLSQKINYYGNQKRLCGRYALQTHR